MKKLLLLLLIITACTFKVSAQTFNPDAFKEGLGKSGTLCDEVSSVRTFSDTLTLINMGGSYPNQKYTIAVKGKKITIDKATLTGKKLCVTGIFELHKNRPEIVATEPSQISFP